MKKIGKFRAVFFSRLDVNKYAAYELRGKHQDNNLYCKECLIIEKEVAQINKKYSLKKAIAENESRYKFPYILSILSEKEKKNTVIDGWRENIKYYHDSIYKLELKELYEEQLSSIHSGGASEFHVAGTTMIARGRPVKWRN